METPVQQNHPNEWIIDSGAANHITGDLSCITNPRLTNTLFRGIGGTVTATTVGSVRMKVQNGKGHTVLLLSNVYFVPGAAENLVSTECLALDRYYYSHEGELIYRRHEDGSAVPVANVYTRRRTPYIQKVQETTDESQSKCEKLQVELNNLKAQVEDLRGSSLIAGQLDGHCNEVLAAKGAQMQPNGILWSRDSVSHTVVEMAQDVAQEKKRVLAFTERIEKSLLED